jgi:hypothetical protein
MGGALDLLGGGIPYRFDQRGDADAARLPVSNEAPVLS